MHKNTPKINGKLPKFKTPKFFSGTGLCYSVMNSARIYLYIGEWKIFTFLTVHLVSWRSRTKTPVWDWNGDLEICSQGRPAGENNQQPLRPLQSLT